MRGELIRRPGTPLANPRHELYARHRAAGTCKAKAYREAGYKGDRREAHRLEATNADIQSRITELQAEMFETEKLTPEWIKRRLMIEAESAETGSARQE